MKLAVRIVIAVLSTIGFVALALNFLLPYTVDCRSVILRSAQSPDATYVATISASTCETPSNSGTHIYLQKAGTSEQRGFKVFDNSSTDFELTWKSRSTLVVSYPRTVNLLARSRDIYGIYVEFEQR